MPSRSLSASRSSISARRTSPGILVAATVACAVLGAVGWAVNREALAAAGPDRGDRVRRRLRGLPDRLRAPAARDGRRRAGRRRRASSSRSSSRSPPSPARSTPSEIVERACDEAKRLFDARSARFVPPGRGRRRKPKAKLVVPLAVRGEPIGSIEVSTLGCIRALGPHARRRARRLRLARGRERPPASSRPMSARPSARA